MKTRMSLIIALFTAIVGRAQTLPEDFSYVPHPIIEYDLTKVDSITLDVINNVSGNDGYSNAAGIHTYRISMDVKYIEVGAFMQKRYLDFTNYVIIIVEDADTIYDLSKGQKKGDMFQGYPFYIASLVNGMKWTTCGGKFRMIVPMGKASLIVHKWGLQPHPWIPIYSPVPVYKKNDGLSTMAMSEDNPASSFTYEGVKYENFYDFDMALTKKHIFHFVNFDFGLEQYYQRNAKEYVRIASSYYERNGNTFLSLSGTPLPTRDKETIINPNMDCIRYPRVSLGYPTYGWGRAEMTVSVPIYCDVFPKSIGGVGVGFMLDGFAADTLYCPLAWTDNIIELHNAVTLSYPHKNELDSLLEQKFLAEEHRTAVWNEWHDEIIDWSYDPNYPPLTREELDRANFLLSDWDDWSLESGAYYNDSSKVFPYRTIKPLMYDDNVIFPNYFKAGTGAAVPRESDGCRNFYFSTSTQAFWPCNNTVIPSNRAYLALPVSMISNAKQISFVIDEGESETTGIVNIAMTEDGKLIPCDDNDDSWYALDGRKLDGKPITKGVYIHNGRKEVIR